MKNSYQYIHDINGKVRRCSMCAPGTKVFQVCTEESDTLCQPCPENQFIASFNNVTRCNPCRRPCSRSLRFETEMDCAPNHDRSCRCIKGFHDLESRFCIRHSKCKPGFGVETLGNAAIDTVCHACTSGRFSSLFSSFERCRPRVDCANAGRALKQRGSSTRDNICGLAKSNISSILPTFISASTSTVGSTIISSNPNTHHAEVTHSWLWISLFVVALAIMLSIIIAICICKFGQCSPIKMLRAQQRGILELGEIPPIAEELSTDCTQRSNLSESTLHLTLQEDVPHDNGTACTIRSSASLPRTTSQETNEGINDMLPSPTVSYHIMQRFENDLQKLINGTNSVSDSVESLPSFNFSAERH
ncbi:tumor necrosis factor receptor superfamily member 21-like isoform X1 [Styela clava]